MVFAGARRALLAPGLFTPRSLPGLNLWLDASQIVGSDGDPVATWLDLSGKGNHATQATEAKRPTYKVGIVNGRPVVRFDGTDDWLSITLGATLSQPLTYLAVVKFAAIGAVMNIIDSTDATGTNRVLYGQTSTPANRWRYYAGAVASATLPDTNWHIPVAVINSASSVMHVDGTQVVTGDSGAQNLPGIRIGADNVGTGQLLNGDIAELIIVSGALSTALRQKAERYFSGRYGITVS